MNNQGTYDYVFKVLLIGNSGVGKSSLIVRFSDDQFTDTHMPTIGVDFKLKTLEVDNKVCKLQIWDTAGQDRFKTITQSYYKGSHGVIITYDITDRDSFAKVSEWMSQVDQHASENISRVLVGNKKDLEDKREVPFHEGKELADNFNVIFLETSAKDCSNVGEAFENLTREIKAKVAKKPAGKDMREGSVRLNKAQKIQKSGGGC